MVNKTSRSIYQVVIEDIRAKHLILLNLKLEVTQKGLSIRVFENEHIVLVFVIIFNSLALQSVLFTHVFTLLTVLFLFCAFFLHELSLLSPLSFDSFLV